MFLKSSIHKAIVSIGFLLLSFSISVNAQNVDVTKRKNEMKRMTSEIAKWVDQKKKERPPSADWSHSGRITKIIGRGDALRGEQDITRWYDFTMSGGWKSVYNGKWSSYRGYRELIWPIELTTVSYHNAPECDAPQTVTKKGTSKVKVVLDFASGYIRMSVLEGAPFAETTALSCFPPRSDGYVAYRNSVADKRIAASKRFKAFYTKNIRLPYNFLSFINKLDIEEKDVLIVATKKLMTESGKSATEHINSYYEKYNTKRQKPVTDNPKKPNNTSKRKTYTKELNELNTFLRTFDGGHYGPLTINNGRLYCQIKGYGKSSIELSGISKVIVQGNNVSLRCYQNSYCYKSTSGEQGKNMSFSSLKPFNKDRLRTLLSNLVSEVKK
jgi:hypothetical protein